MHQNLCKEEISSLVKAYYPKIINGLGTDTSLIDGTAGNFLFFYQSYTFFKDEESLLALKKVLSSLLKNLNENKSGLFSDGLVGIGVVFHLCDEIPFDLNLTSFYSSLDEIIENEIANQAEMVNMDFLHGMIGSGIYALCRKRTDLLELIINNLNEFAYKDEFGYRWHSKYEIRDKEIDVIQLSLSHGISSVINFLSQCVKLEIKNKELAMKILYEAIKYLRHSTLMSCLSIFPEVIPVERIELKIRESRLAWCNGDLGVGISLLIVGINIKDQKLIQEAELILLETTRRRSKKQTGVIDDGLCHGSAGIALMYKLAHQLTGKKEFLEAFSFWMCRLMIEARRSALSDEGYRSFLGEDKGWGIDQGFLNGLSGIGLTLIDFISEKESNWKSILLLSNVK